MSAHDFGYFRLRHRKALRRTEEVEDYPSGGERPPNARLSDRYLGKMESSSALAATANGLI